MLRPRGPAHVFATLVEVRVTTERALPVTMMLDRPDLMVRYK